MTARQITPPASLAVTLEAAKWNLRIDGDQMDGLITTWIEGITAAVEHELGRALILQDWRVTLDAFPVAIRLEMPPVALVRSVKYIDPAGVLQTMDIADYVTDRVSEPGYVLPAPGKSWPATAAQVNAVMVDYTCGYGDTMESIPANVRLYILAKLETDHGPRSQTTGSLAQSDRLSRLLDACRVWSL